MEGKTSEVKVDDLYYLDSTRFPYLNEAQRIELAAERREFIDNIPSGEAKEKIHQLIQNAGVEENLETLGEEHIQPIEIKDENFTLTIEDVDDGEGANEPSKTQYHYLKGALQSHQKSAIKIPLDKVSMDCIVSNQT